MKCDSKNNAGVGRLLTESPSMPTCGFLELIFRTVSKAASRGLQASQRPISNRQEEEAGSRVGLLLVDIVSEFKVECQVGLAQGRVAASLWSRARGEC